MGRDPICLRKLELGAQQGLPSRGGTEPEPEEEGTIIGSTRVTGDVISQQRQRQ
jgi:hypothetical protein